MYTLDQLRANYPAYRIVGSGLFAVICGSAKRITLAESLEVARDLKHTSCGFGCRRYDSPHEGIRLDAPAPVAKARFRIKEYRD